MQDGNENYQKGFPLSGMGTEITKKPSHYLGRERETQKSLPAVWEREFMAFPLGNIWEREFPLMLGTKAYWKSIICQASEIKYNLKVKMDCILVRGKPYMKA